MKATISSKFNGSVDEVWSLVKKSSTLLYITKGALGFSGSESFPAEWELGKTESARLLIFGLLPVWKHSITFNKICESEKVIHTNEGGGLVSVWDHLVKVEPSNEANSCYYTDDVEIQAGILTPFIWLFAQVFYRYRQFRWGLLLQSVKES